MVQRSRTKDEKFILALYDEALNLGDACHPVDRYFIGKRLGMHKHAIDMVCRDLAQSNFIKKEEDSDAVYITPNGLRLIDHLNDT